MNLQKQRTQKTILTIALGVAVVGLGTNCVIKNTFGIVVCVGATGLFIKMLSSYKKPRSQDRYQWSYKKGYFKSFRKGW